MKTAQVIKLYHIYVVLNLIHLKNIKNYTNNQNCIYLKIKIITEY